ncbi:MAG: nucleotidyl transferase AbiEii/AbiGii toxin family protein [Bacteroidota bacterium]
MAANYLHHHPDFSELLRIVAEEKNILPGLIEKDYWIMHVLFGLQQQGYKFELKGGTSLSKGYGIINRFSEDIDIHISPPTELSINENPNNTKPRVVEARRAFYDLLAMEIQIDGISEVERDYAFDNPRSYSSGGIRLFYENKTDLIQGVKEGILLEAGFDTVTPNHLRTISSWAYDRAIDSIELIDNRAVNVVCYDPGYTLVEKLQTIVRKFRQEQEGAAPSVNYMRQYYDIYSLLANPEILRFIGTDAYLAHKKLRFSAKDAEIPVNENEAFLLTNQEIRTDFRRRYESTSALYYNGQPDFEEVLYRISQYLQRM